MSQSALAATLPSPSIQATRSRLSSRVRVGLAVLFFLSGATGLVYQLLWVRVLYQAFGSTVQSVTTVVAAYMGGLGLGAWLIGRWADRHPRPAALYGWLEVAIGVFGVASPLVLALSHQAWIAAAQGLSLGPTASIALRFGLAALVLFIPTTLMGATLPVLTRAVSDGEGGALKHELGKLYGLNTLGAVAGTMAAGFFLIEHVGIRYSLWLTAFTNVGLGIAAVGLARGFNPLAPAPRSVAPLAKSAAAANPLRRVALILLAVTAFVALLNEIAWTRVLVMVIGGSTYAFTLVLGVFLLGIGVGSAVVARRSGAFANTAAAAAAAQGLTAAGAALLIGLTSLLPSYIIKIFGIPGLQAPGRLALFGLAIGAVVLLPSVGMGMTFPLLAELASGGRRSSGRAGDVGRAYAVNTVGSILGAVLTGFVLVVTLGTDLTLRAGVALNAIAALMLAFLAARGVPEGSAEHRRLRIPLLLATGLGCLGVAAVMVMPRWNTEEMDIAPAIYGRDLRTPKAIQQFLSHTGSRQLAFQEGRNATVSVWESDQSRALAVNGKVDASDVGDMDTQVMLALAPLAARPGATSAFVIGYGAGVTVGTLADAPGMRRVRVAEIEPAVLAMSSFFSHVNGDALARPTVSAVVDDARSALQLEPEKFDIIVSEPSNPWVAGIATLYTPEFLGMARDRLTPGGVFCQWIQLYQLPIPVVAGIVENVRQAFPHVEVWMASPHDILVLGSLQPFVYDDKWLSQLTGPGAPLEERAREWVGMRNPQDHFGRFLLGPRGVRALTARAGLVHTDDRPALEYQAARRFLDDLNTDHTIDSLLLLRDPAEDRGSLAQMARALAVEPEDWHDLPLVETLHAREPANPEWTARMGMHRLARRDTVGAEVLLKSAGQYPAALLTRAMLALARNDASGSRSLLRATLVAGGDTARVHAALALRAARLDRWSEAAEEAGLALRNARVTFSHPFPQDFLDVVLQELAVNGAPDTARKLIAEAGRARPGWAALYELDALAALRLGDCRAAAGRFAALQQFGVRRSDAGALVRNCQRLLQQ